MAQLLRIGDAAREIGVSVDTLRRWTDEGLVPVVVLPSGHRRYSPDAIAALIQERSA